MRIEGFLSIQPLSTSIQIEREEIKSNLHFYEKKNEKIVFAWNGWFSLWKTKKGMTVFINFPKEMYTLRTKSEENNKFSYFIE